MWRKSFKEVEELDEDMFTNINQLGIGVMMNFVDFESKNETVKE